MKKRIRNLVVILVLVVTMGSVVMFCTPGSACWSLQQKCDTQSDFIQRTCKQYFANASQAEIACIQAIPNCDHILTDLIDCRD